MRFACAFALAATNGTGNQQYEVCLWVLNFMCNFYYFIFFYSCQVALLVGYLIVFHVVEMFLS